MERSSRIVIIKIRFNWIICTVMVEAIVLCVVVLAMLLGADYWLSQVTFKLENFAKPFTTR